MWFSCVTCMSPPKGTRYQMKLYTPCRLSKRFPPLLKNKAVRLTAFSRRRLSTVACIAWLFLWQSYLGLRTAVVRVPTHKKKRVRTGSGDGRLRGFRPPRPMQRRYATTSKTAWRLSCCVLGLCRSKTMTRESEVRTLPRVTPDRTFLGWCNIVE